MSSFADKLQRKPSGQDRTIRQKQHDRGPRSHTPGIGYRVLEYHQHHPGFENTQAEVAYSIDCGETTVRNLINEYGDKGLNSVLGTTALYHGFQVSKRDMGGFWRISVEPYRIKPIYLDPDAYAKVEYTFSVDDKLIENPEDFFAEIKATVKKNRPSLKGLSVDQDQDAGIVYGGWTEDYGGEE